MLEMTKEYQEHMTQVLNETFRDQVIEAPFLEALESKNYPRFYALLKRLDDPMPYSVCEAALDATCQAFSRALDHNPVAWKNLQQLAYEAARLNRPKHLAVLLERGVQINTESLPVTSPLIGALWGRSLTCLNLLLEQPELKPFYPPELLTEWAGGGMGDTMLDFCLQAIAARLMPDQYYPTTPLPLPPELKLEHAVGAENWSLALRLLREERVTAEDFRGVIEKWPQLAGCPDFLPAAFAILAQRPELAEDELTAGWLALAALGLPSDDSGGLQAILGALGGREQIVLNGTFETMLRSQSEPSGSWEELLERWEARLGSRLRPVLDRNDLPDLPQDPGRAASLLRRCSVVGKPPADQPSSLARWLQQKGSLEMFRAALEPGGVLEGERLELLLHEIPTGTEASAEDRVKRAVLLARMT